MRVEPKPIYREKVSDKPVTNFISAEFRDAGLTPAIRFQAVSAIAALLAVDELDGRIRKIIDASGQRKLVLTFRGDDGELDEAVALNVSKAQIKSACLLIRTQMDMTLRTMIVGEQGTPDGADLLVPNRTLVTPNGQKLQ